MVDTQTLSIPPPFGESLYPLLARVGHESPQLVAGSNVPPVAETGFSVAVPTLVPSTSLPLGSVTCTW